MRSVGPDGWLWIISVLASGTAAVSLWLGAARVPVVDRARYRWLAVAAVAWCVGGATQQVLAGQGTDFTAPLTLADLLPLLALVPMVMGIRVLAAPGAGPARRPGFTTQQVVGRAMDGYVTASALLIIGWLTVFGSEYHRSGADPQTFLLGMLRPLAAVVALCGLLPGVVAGARQVAVPYLALIAVAVGDTFGAAVRLAGGHEPRAAELTAKIAGYLLLAAAPWVFSRQATRYERDAVPGDLPPAGGTSRATAALGGLRPLPAGMRQLPAATQRPVAAAIIAALAAAGAAVLTAVNELGGGTRLQPVVIVAGSGAVLALVVRVLGLVRENVLALTAARVSGRHVRELADRTSDAVLICDLEGTVTYSSPSVAAYGYATGGILGRNLAEFLHPEDRPASIREVGRIVAAISDGDSFSCAQHGAPDPIGPAAGRTDMPAGRGDSPAAGRGDSPAEPLTAGRGDVPGRPADARRGDVSGTAAGSGISPSGPEGGGDAGTDRGIAVPPGGRSDLSDHNDRGRGGDLDSGSSGASPGKDAVRSEITAVGAAARGGGRRTSAGADLRHAAGSGAALAAEAPVVHFHCRVLAADGTWRHVECTVSRYQQPGEGDQLLITARDLSDQIALRQQLTDLIFHDQLTGLPNRAYFEERVVDMLNRRRDRTAAATGQERDLREDLAAELVALQVAAVFLHLDGLFAVKDSAGHAAVDGLLTQAARRLREAVPPQHTLARWGGDEFAVLVEARGGAKETVDLAEQLSRCITAQPFSVAGRDVAISASVGVAFAGDSPAGDVMRNADVAMSRARAAGGGRVEIFAAHMHADIVRRLELTSDLQRAISEEALSLEFQPIVELATGRMTGAEALVRWRRAGELVPPGDFLALAEESGLAVPLGEWVLRESCRHAARWRQQADSGFGVSVNVSPRQIAAPGFVDSVLTALADSDLPASALTLELTEQVLVAHRGETPRRLAELRRQEVRIAVDDFGTGYASLGSLRQLPVDIIKIDPSFVSGVGTDDTLTLLTGAIVRLGHDLGVTVVAEGIERPGQLETLKEMGCARGQGYLIARPMSAPHVDAMIAGGTGPYGPDVPEQGRTPASAS